MESVLKEYFGYSQFRPYQKEIIEKVLAGKDCLVVMATGSGKSLCYQIPPLVSERTAIVVSPLLSLMYDQVMSLKQRGIKAEYLGSTQTKQAVYSEAEKGTFDILYMTPEKACSLPPRFWANLLNVGICLLAVDEAHCISEWGHDFRKEYKRLHMLRDVLPGVPFMSLTATATEKVRGDIVHSLKLNGPYVAIGSFDRQNLFYGVKSLNRTASFVDGLVAEISKFNANAGSTIMYCTTIKDTEQIWQSLTDAGIKAGKYHGQMGNKAREESHRSFIRDELQVMVATIAFGMGIDKPNIRCVIHYGCPKSLESYYQESGRCGRDGLASICWLYFSRSDFFKADFYLAEAHSEVQRTAIMASLREAEKYCHLTTCRRKFLLQYFDEESPDNCGNCDNCTGSKRERDLSRESFLLLTCIQFCGGHWGLNMPINILRGSRSRKILDNNFDKLPSHGLGKDYSPTWWKAFAELLIAQDYLKETMKDVYKFVSISPRGVQFINTTNTMGQRPLVLALTAEMIDEEEHGGQQSKVGDLKNLVELECEGFSEAEVKLYHALLDTRMKLANATGTAPYAICGDQTIKKIAKIRPSTRARLANIDGVNQHLVTMYGDDFLQSISHMSQGLELPLDGEAMVQTAVTKKVYPISQRNSTIGAAKLEAWKMWQQSGLSFQDIAKSPGRPAPIKEQTVIAYILEAAREGCEIDWTRFCGEIGLTPEMVSQIRSAVAKVGRERLKPIKEELPTNVSYDQIKAFLVMEEVRESATMGHTSSTSADDPNRISESPSSDNKNTAAGTDRGSSKSMALVRDRASPRDPLTPCSSRTEAQMRQPRSNDDDEPNGKKQRMVVEDDKSHKLEEASESAIVEWIRDHKEGVLLLDIVKHFKGLKEELIVDLLGRLESEYSVFKKKDLYQAL